jgi:hypothetical protein
MCFIDSHLQVVVVRVGRAPEGGTWGSTRACMCLLRFLAASAPALPLCCGKEPQGAAKTTSIFSDTSMHWWILRVREERGRSRGRSKDAHVRAGMPWFVLRAQQPRAWEARRQRQVEQGKSSKAKTRPLADPRCP